MFRNIVIVIFLLLSTGCSSLKPPTQEAESGNVTGAPVNELVAKAPISVDCNELDSAYSLWGAVAKGLAGLAGLTPAAGVASGVAAIVGASSAGVAFYADTRTQAYISNCTKTKI